MDISPPNMAKNMVLTYLHFRILKISPCNPAPFGIHLLGFEIAADEITYNCLASACESEQWQLSLFLLLHPGCQSGIFFGPHLPTDEWKQTTGTTEQRRLRETKWCHAFNNQNLHAHTHRHLQRHSPLHIDEHIGLISKRSTHTYT